MDYTLILLRLIHIVAAFTWVAIGASITFIIIPSLQAAGERRAQPLAALLDHPAIVRVLPISSGLTMLAGILMYIFSRVGSHFSSAGNIVLGLGALVGIVAGIHGGAVAGRARQALRRAVPDDAAAGAPALRETAARALTQARVSMALTIVALLLMASARYL